ncbi:MAG: lysophospholipid acyltransferase family protein [Bacteroidales bacterium]|nr:lysophospholipid acyltransferase family protein [Bacteroidales bacterium]
MKIFINTFSDILTKKHRSKKDWDGVTKGSLWGHRFFIWLIKRSGLSFAYGFAGVVIGYYIIFSPRTSSMIYRYFRKRHLFSRWKSMRMTYRNYHCFAKILIDKTAIPTGMGNKFSYQFENHDEVTHLLGQKQGCIFISAHVGNWDVAGHLFGKHNTHVNIVMLDAEHQRIKKYLESVTGEKSYKIIALKDDMSHTFEIGKALINKEYICFQGDRHMKGTTTLNRTFLGAPASFPAGPFQIAAHAQVPVVFFFAVRKPGRTYRFCFYIAHVDQNMTKREITESLASQYVCSLEQVLRRYPEQWFNYYEFWDKEQENLS